MISEKLFNQLNDQMNYEFYSANIYLAMAAYAQSKDLMGIANFFTVQVEEERAHAMGFFNYINRMNGRVLIEGYPDPQNEHESILDAFKKALSHEKIVTQRIYNLMDTATEEKEYATMSFLKWYIDEQVEEESTAFGIIKKLEIIGNDTNGLFMLDTELAARVFVPPVIA